MFRHLPAQVLDAAKQQAMKISLLSDWLVRICKEGDTSAEDTDTRCTSLQKRSLYYLHAFPMLKKK